MNEVTSRTFDEFSTRQLHDILRLRCDVLVVEQACVYGWPCPSTVTRAGPGTGLR